MARLVLASLLVGALAVHAEAQTARLQQYETKYYVIHSDLDADAVREAALRITAMAEEYQSRTKGFAGAITRKMPFFLFRKPEDYRAAGGLLNSVGVFDPNSERLMAIAGEETSDETWRVVQHEGFHQFAHFVIGGRLPIWVNEGIAEYFGHGIFTGDGYVMGAIPPDRLKRIQAWIRGGNTVSVQQMMSLRHETWNVQMSIVNYDQAWSMVHFLAHADNQRYQPAFNQFLRDVSRGNPWENAWNGAFGRGVREFEQKWKKHWTEMPANPTADLYAKATTATLTSFYARAFAQGQSFESFDEFLAAARDGKLRCHADDWLPPTLLGSAVKRISSAGAFSIEKVAGRFQLVCTTPDGQKLAGSFQVTANRRIKPGSVAVTTTTPKAGARKP